MLKYLLCYKNINTQVLLYFGTANVNNLTVTAYFGHFRFATYFSDDWQQHIYLAAKTLLKLIKISKLMLKSIN